MDFALHLKCYYSRVKVRTEAIITPSVLEWGRVQIGLRRDTAARKVGIADDLLGAWEAGECRPTLRQAHSLAKLYALPFAAFYLPAPPTDKLRLPRDYRRSPAPDAAGTSPALRLDIRKAGHRREVALELLEAMGKKAPSFVLTAALSDDPERVGEGLRDALGVGIPQQVAWRDPRLAFNAWRERSEDLGVMVLQTATVPLSEMRAYSIHTPPLPIVVVNRKDAYSGRAFSLMHELAHLLLHGEGLCDLEEAEPGDTSDAGRVETFCNAVAAACLMPAGAFLANPTVKAREPGTWTDVELLAVSRAFSVSREAVLRRLLTFGRTTPAFYRKKRAELLEEYRRLVRRKGFLSPTQNAVSILGQPFVRLVLSRLDAGLITTSDASDYLGLRVKHLAKLAASVEGGGA